MRSKSCDDGGAAPLSRRGPSFTTRGSGSWSSPFSETTSRKFLSAGVLKRAAILLLADARSPVARRHVGRLLRRQRLVEHRIDVALARRACRAAPAPPAPADSASATSAPPSAAAIRRLARLRLARLWSPWRGDCSSSSGAAEPAADPSAGIRARERASARRAIGRIDPAPCAPPRPRPCGSIPRARGARA